MASKKSTARTPAVLANKDYERAINSLLKNPPSSLSKNAKAKWKDYITSDKLFIQAYSGIPVPRFGLNLDNQPFIPEVDSIQTPTLSEEEVGQLQERFVYLVLLWLRILELENSNENQDGTRLVIPAQNFVLSRSADWLRYAEWLFEVKNIEKITPGRVGDQFGVQIVSDTNVTQSWRLYDIFSPLDFQFELVDNNLFQQVNVLTDAVRILPTFYYPSASDEKKQFTSATEPNGWDIGAFTLVDLENYIGQLRFNVSDDSTVASAQPPISSAFGQISEYNPDSNTVLLQMDAKTFNLIQSKIVEANVPNYDSMQSSLYLKTLALVYRALGIQPRPIDGTRNQKEIHFDANDLLVAELRFLRLWMFVARVAFYQYDLATPPNIPDLASILFVITRDGTLFTEDGWKSPSSSFRGIDIENVLFYRYDNFYTVLAINPTFKNDGSVDELNDLFANPNVRWFQMAPTQRDNIISFTPYELDRKILNKEKLRRYSPIVNGTDLVQPAIDRNLRIDLKSASPSIVKFAQAINIPIAMEPTFTDKLSIFAKNLNYMELENFALNLMDLYPHSIKRDLTFVEDLAEPESSFGVDLETSGLKGVVVLPGSTPDSTPISDTLASTPQPIPASALVPIKEEQQPSTTTSLLRQSGTLALQLGKGLLTAGGLLGSAFSGVFGSSTQAGTALPQTNAESVLGPSGKSSSGSNAALSVSLSPGQSQTLVKQEIVDRPDGTVKLEPATSTSQIIVEQLNNGEELKFPSREIVKNLRALKLVMKDLLNQSVLVGILDKSRLDALENLLSETNNNTLTNDAKDLQMMIDASGFIDAYLDTPMFNLPFDKTVEAKVLLNIQMRWWQYREREAASNEAKVIINTILQCVAVRFLNATLTDVLQGMYKVPSAFQNGQSVANWNLVSEIIPTTSPFYLILAIEALSWVSNFLNSDPSNMTTNATTWKEYFENVYNKSILAVFGDDFGKLEALPFERLAFSPIEPDQPYLSEVRFIVGSTIEDRDNAESLNENLTHQFKLASEALNEVVADSSLQASNDKAQAFNKLRQGVQEWWPAVQRVFTKAGLDGNADYAALKRRFGEQVRGFGQTLGQVVPLRSASMNVVRQITAAQIDNYFLAVEDQIIRIAWSTYGAASNSSALLATIDTLSSTDQTPISDYYDVQKNLLIVSANPTQLLGSKQQKTISVLAKLNSNFGTITERVHIPFYPSQSVIEKLANQQQLFTSMLKIYGTIAGESEKINDTIQLATRTSKLATFRTKLSGDVSFAMAEQWYRLAEFLVVSTCSIFYDKLKKRSSVQLLTVNGRFPIYTSLAISTAPIVKTTLDQTVSKTQAPSKILASTVVGFVPSPPVTQVVRKPRTPEVASDWRLFVSELKDNVSPMMASVFTDQGANLASNLIISERLVAQLISQ